MILWKGHQADDHKLTLELTYKQTNKQINKQTNRERELLLWKGHQADDGWGANGKSCVALFAILEDKKRVKTGKILENNTILEN